MDNEIWRPVKGWESLYEVSNKGRVKSLDRTYRRKNGYVSYKGRVMKQQENNVGYLFVILKSGDRKQKAFIHRLVAMSFICKPAGENVVNHKDFNPKNNCVENLEWTTPGGNYHYSEDRGRFKRTELWRSNLKKTLDKVMGKPVIGESIVTGSLIFYNALNDCANDGFQPSCVSCCCNGKRKTHAGFKWRFAYELEIDAMKEECGCTS